MHVSEVDQTLLILARLDGMTPAECREEARLAPSPAAALAWDGVAAHLELPGWQQ